MRQSRSRHQSRLDSHTARQVGTPVCSGAVGQALPCVMKVAVVSKGQEFTRFRSCAAKVHESMKASYRQFLSRVLLVSVRSTENGDGMTCTQHIL